METPSTSENRKHAFIFINGNNPIEHVSCQANFNFVPLAPHPGCSQPKGLELYQEIIGGTLRALLNLSRITPAVVYH